MSQIPFSSIAAKYKELADLFITDINANRSIVLYYPNPQLTPITNTINQEPNNLDRLGGRTPVSEMEGRFQEAGSNVQETVLSESLEARIYWEPKNIDGKLARFNIKDNKNVCKMIASIEYRDKLKYATYALISGKKCKLIIEDIPHGLITAYYITTYWEVMNG